MGLGVWIGGWVFVLGWDRFWVVILWFGALGGVGIILVLVVVGGCLVSFAYGCGWGLGFWLCIGGGLRLGLWCLCFCCDLEWGLFSGWGGVDGV